MTLRDLERSRAWPHYLENGWRYRFVYNRAPIENMATGVSNMSRDVWRHVTMW